MQTESEAKYASRKDYLTLPQRFGELTSVIFILLLLAFYAYNQIENTGFFTSKFGGWEMLALYGSISLSLLPPLMRAKIARRNSVRPLEAFCNLFFAFSILYLLLVFPFNFAHFPDALPAFVRFMFWWLTNDVARILIFLGFLGALASFITNIVKYGNFKLD